MKVDSLCAVVFEYLGLSNAFCWLKSDTGFLGLETGMYVLNFLSYELLNILLCALLPFGF